LDPFYQSFKTAYIYSSGRAYTEEEDNLFPVTTEVKVFFGNLIFAVSLFLNNFVLLADPTLSGQSSTKRFFHKQRIAKANLSFLPGRSNEENLAGSN
jgi:hypothetical protein